MFEMGRAIREAKAVVFVQYVSEDPKSLEACKEFVGDIWEGRVALLGTKAAYTILNEDGRRQIVYPGSYIVQGENGIFDVVGKVVFESDYRLAELSSGGGILWGEQTELNLWSSGNQLLDIEPKGSEVVVGRIVDHMLGGKYNG